MEKIRLVLGCVAAVCIIVGIAVALAVPFWNEPGKEADDPNKEGE